MKNNHVAASVFGILLVLLAGIAAAQPVDKFPEQFYGYVTVNGIPAPNGVLVSAKFEGKDVGATLTSGGNYNLIIAMKEQDEGQTVFFYVQNVNTNIQSVFQSGNSVRFDLSATMQNFCGDGTCSSGESCSSCPSDCGACPPSGGGSSGGGSSGGGGSAGGGTCTENWICTDWNECSNYVQKRVCADTNRCGTNSSKPVERQDCVMTVICQAGQKVCTGDKLMVCSALGTTWIEEKTCQTGCSNGTCNEDLAAAGPAAAGAGAATGFFLLEPAAWPYWIVIIVVIIILGWYFLLRKKGKKQ